VISVIGLVFHLIELICIIYMLSVFICQLAARIAVSNLHKNTKKSFSET